MAIIWPIFNCFHVGQYLHQLLPSANIEMSTVLIFYPTQQILNHRNLIGCVIEIILKGSFVPHSFKLHDNVTPDATHGHFS
jgi:hypothetical protein